MSNSIFIIDDNPEITTLIKLSLEHLDDYALKSFSTPQAALHQLDSGNLPDLIITDLKMSKMNGIEFLVRLSKFEKSIPTIIFTGHAESLPPGCNCITIFKDAHGFDRLVETVEKILGVADKMEQQA